MAGEYNGGAGRALRARLHAGRAEGPERSPAGERATPPLVLDGATGTELERQGLPAEAPLWSARALRDAPGAVLEVHRRYVAAGAEALTANTFRTQARSLAAGGLEAGVDRLLDSAADRLLTARAVELARRAADEAPRRVFVLGSDPPLEDCYAPERVPGDAALAREHARHVANLLDAGADAVLVETMNCTREAVAALRAVREAGAEGWVSFCPGADGRLLSGEPLAEALEAVAPLDPLLVGVNCLPPRVVPACLPALRAARLPFGVFANLGAPLDARGLRRTDDATPAVFARHAEAWVVAGARAVGGCCGTTPAHLAAVAAAVRGPAQALGERQ